MFCNLGFVFFLVENWVIKICAVFLNTHCHTYCVIHVHVHVVLVFMGTFINVNHGLGMSDKFKVSAPVSHLWNGYNGIVFMDTECDLK